MTAAAGNRQLIQRANIIRLQRHQRYGRLLRGMEVPPLRLLSARHIDRAVFTVRQHGDPKDAPLLVATGHPPKGFRTRRHRHI